MPRFANAFRPWAIVGNWVLHPGSGPSRTGNAVNPDFLVGEAPFDLILCRNLFIYLTNDARRQVIANLDRLLAPGGWLVLIAEADRLPPGWFVAIGPRVRDLSPRGDRKHRYGRATISSGRPPTRRLRGCSLFTSQSPRVTPCLKRLMARSRRSLSQYSSWLANWPTPPASEARAACEQLIGQTTDDPEGLLAVGSGSSGAGSPEDAAVAFRKAGYLDPNQAEAIAHMIVICDARGDAGRPHRSAGAGRLTAKEQS